MKVKSESEVAQSCPTPSDPMDCSLPGSSVHGIFQARVLELGGHLCQILKYILVLTLCDTYYLLHSVATEKWTVSNIKQLAQSHSSKL